MHTHTGRVRSRGREAAKDVAAAVAVVLAERVSFVVLCSFSFQNKRGGVAPARLHRVAATTTDGRSAGFMRAAAPQSTLVSVAENNKTAPGAGFYQRDIVTKASTLNSLECEFCT